MNHDDVCDAEYDEALTTPEETFGWCELVLSLVIASATSAIAVYLVCVGWPLLVMAVS